MWKDDEFLGTIVELERVVKKHIAKDKQEELVRKKRKTNTIGFIMLVCCKKVLPQICKYTK